MAFVSFYSLSLGLGNGASQTEIIQKFKSLGDDVIQTASGLCLKSARSSDEIQNILEEVGAKSVKVEKVDHRSASLPDDVAAFVGKK